jgi:hypothetical protein
VDALDSTVQARAVPVRQIFGGKNQYRDLAPSPVAPQRVKELEAVDLGHHEVDHNDVGPRLGEARQRDTPVLCLRYVPALLVERAPQTCSHRVVVVNDQHVPPCRLAYAAQYAG